MGKFIKPMKPLDEAQRKHAKIAIGLFIGCLAGVGLHLLYFTLFESFDDWVCILIFAAIFIAPGWIADGGMLVVGGGPPLDFGHVCRDGRRLFGPGKTIRGFFLGPLLVGIPAALAIHWIVYLNWPAIEEAAHAFFVDPKYNYTLYATSDALVADLKLYLLGAADGTNDWATFQRLIPRVALCAYGAPVGDLIGSWAKRRIGAERGQPVWIVDQIDFLGGCFLMALPYVIGSLNPHIIIFLIIFTPSLTVCANTISYLTGHKNEPW